MRERWVVYQADKYEEVGFRYRGTPNEQRVSVPKSLSDEHAEVYDSYTNGSTAVEEFIDNHAVEMPNPLARIEALEAEVEAIKSQAQFYISQADTIVDATRAEVEKMRKRVVDWTSKTDAHNRKLLEALRRAVFVADGLAQQQATEDSWYLESLSFARTVLDEAEGK